MTHPPVYVSTSIPYVNAHPHLGHALEFVQADVLARHYGQRGHPVRLQSGTDDNALKNVTAARAAGEEPATFVDRNAERFVEVQRLLGVSVDGFVRTSHDPRHRQGVQRLWRLSAARGDFYRRTYRGLYCPGCEQFYAPAELLDGTCPEHGLELEEVSEENWFFRLSRYADTIARLIRDGTVRVEPAERRHEVLAWIDAGLTDISVSRPAARAAGWGVPVPEDDEQVVYVWWDALANYVTALGYADDAVEFHQWWRLAHRRIHVVGKGIVRFHAGCWLGLLLSAGLPLPTEIYVHEYLTVAGRKIAKSGASVSVPEVLGRYGADAVRWWLCRDVARVGDTDFSGDRVALRYAQDLAGGIGNLVRRTSVLAAASTTRTVPTPDSASAPCRLAAALPGQVDGHLERFDVRAACAALVEVVGAVNRYLEEHRPWEQPAGSSDRAVVLATALGCATSVATELAPFLPTASERLHRALQTAWTEPALPVFPRQLEPKTGRR